MCVGNSHAISVLAVGDQTRTATLKMATVAAAVADDIVATAAAEASAMDDPEAQKDMLKPGEGPLANVFNAIVRVTVTDGRKFVGRFWCIDKEGAMILIDTVEVFESLVSGGEVLTRNLNVVLIPRTAWVKVERLKDAEQKAVGGENMMKGDVRDSVIAEE